jgi:hypothetical protein
MLREDVQKLGAPFLVPVLNKLPARYTDRSPDSHLCDKEIPDKTRNSNSIKALSSILSICATSLYGILSGNPKP